MLDAGQAREVGTWRGRRRRRVGGGGARFKMRGEGTPVAEEV